MKKKNERTKGTVSKVYGKKPTNIMLRREYSHQCVRYFARTRTRIHLCGKRFASGKKVIQEECPSQSCNNVSPMQRAIYNARHVVESGESEHFVEISFLLTHLACLQCANPPTSTRACIFSALRVSPTGFRASERHADERRHVPLVASNSTTVDRRLQSEGAHCFGTQVKHFPTGSE